MPKNKKTNRHIRHRHNRRTQLKNKKHKLIRRLRGGNNARNIMFGCTTLLGGSSFFKGFDIIQIIVDNLVGKNINKNAYFVYSGDPKGAILDDTTTLQKIEDNRYTIIPSNTRTGAFNINIVDFIKSHTAIKFDIILMAQCSGLVSFFLGEISMGSHNSYDLLVDNMIHVYNSLIENGHIVNLYYNKNEETEEDDEDLTEEEFEAKYDIPILVDFDEYYSMVELIKHLPLFLFCFEAQKMLFDKVSVGIYQKRNDVSYELFQQTCETLKHTITEKMTTVLSKKISREQTFLELIQGSDIKLESPFHYAHQIPIEQVYRRYL